MNAEDFLKQIETKLFSAEFRPEMMNQGEVEYFSALTNGDFTDEYMNRRAAEILYNVHTGKSLANHEYIFAMLMFADKDYVKRANIAKDSLVKDFSNINWSNMFDSRFEREAIDAAALQVATGKIAPKLKKDLEELAGEIYKEDIKGGHGTITGIIDGEMTSYNSYITYNSYIKDSDRNSSGYARHSNDMGKGE